MANDAAAENAPRSNWRWWICGLLLLATMINYMDRLTLNVTAKRIMEELSLDELQYGHLESAFAYAFALGSMVFGWMVDRWSVRWIYPAAVLLWSLAGFATGLVLDFTGLLCCRFLLGLAEGGNWPSALRTTQHVLPPSERTLGNSILQSGTSIGAIVTPLIVLALVTPEPGSWRFPFLVIGVVGFFWIVLWFYYVGRDDLVVEKRPSSFPLAILSILVVLLALDLGAHNLRQLGGLLDLPALATLSVEQPWLPLATKVVVTVVGIGCVFVWLMRSTRDDTRLPRNDFLRRFCVLGVLVVTINATWHFLRAWLPLFLQKVHGYDEKETSGLLVVYYVFTDIGCLTAGFATLRLARLGLPVHRSRLMVFGSCALVTSLTLVVAVLPAGFLLIFLLLVIGFAALGLFPNYYSFSQEITVQYQGKVTGALGCTCWLSMSLLHELVGDSIKRTGSYGLAMALAGLTPLVGFVALLLFWGKTEPPEELPVNGPAAEPIAQEAAATVGEKL